MLLLQFVEWQVGPVVAEWWRTVLFHKLISNSYSGPYLALAVECMSTSVTGSVRGEVGVWDAIEGAAVSFCF